MLIKSNNLIIVPSVSCGLNGVRKKPYQSDLWKNSTFECKRLITGVTFVNLRTHSCCRLQKLALFLAPGELKLLGYRYTKVESRRFASLHIPKHDCDLWNSQQKRRFSSIPIADSSRMSRFQRADAQNALFDYLHCTRCLHFTDAEHMSKNSPMFLQSLLSKVHNGEEIGPSISKFVRFNPINEFEPFFESLGLKPSEFRPLLPHNLIFLHDDDVLLENYHVLCNYGVPRSKIGKIYKEGTEIFSYSYGVLDSKLRSYENLGLCKHTIIKLVACCPALLIGDLNLDFLRVLEKLKAIGVELDLIRGSLSDKNVYYWERIHKMLNFIECMGCNKRDLSKLISEHPQFVFDDSGKRIYILAALLLKLGLQTSDILLLFVQYPRILAGRFIKNLCSSINFLVDIGMDIEDIRRVVKNHPQILGASSCNSPSFVMKNYKLSEDKLCDIIREDPNQFTYMVARKKSSIVSLPKVEGNFLREKTDFLLKLGFLENSDELAKALKKFCGRGDLLQKRFDFLVGLGLDYHTVAKMIRLVPTVLNQTIGVLDKKTNYLLNDLGYPLEALVAFPSYLCYSMDKIKLRFSMFQWLKEQGVLFSTRNKKTVSSMIALSTILAYSDSRFCKYFVDLHPDGPEEWERLKRLFYSK
ncbi:hypothetical protein AXF42_Ash001900 [Apostasia shenzhenica]|uniref:mTERF domain-containing protein 1, mitochondrial n=1 Tax=Apostasia shenzhenica TaxID=1088818 RepID=A0A2I0ABK0_9ASPA|nr:hypothetical protein AXF42_Ash001900 [Apostasia shenzhenica]